VNWELAQNYQQLKASGIVQSVIPSAQFVELTDRCSVLSVANKVQISAGIALTPLRSGLSVAERFLWLEWLPRPLEAQE
jgi:hypothetical protein